MAYCISLYAGFLVFKCDGVYEYIIQQYILNTQSFASKNDLLGDSDLPNVRGVSAASAVGGGKLVTIATQTSDVYVQENLLSLDESVVDPRSLSALYHGAWPIDKGLTHFAS